MHSGKTWINMCMIQSGHRSPQCLKSSVQGPECTALIRLGKIKYNWITTCIFQENLTNWIYDHFVDRLFVAFHLSNFQWWYYLCIGGVKIVLIAILKLWYLMILKRLYCSHSIVCRCTVCICICNPHNMYDYVLPLLTRYTVHVQYGWYISAPNKYAMRAF